MDMGLFIYLFFFSFLRIVVFAYNPDAGLATNYIQTAALFASSNSTSSSSNINNIRDGDLNTLWTSDACLPEEWMARAYMNVILGACSTTGVCTSTSSTTTNINYVTDGDASSIFNVPVSGSQASFTLTLPHASSIFRIGLRLNNAADVSIQGFTAGSTTAINLATYTVGEVYSHQNFVVNTTTVIATLKLVSTGQFGINNFGVSTEQCYEYIIADLGAVKPVGQVVIKAPTDATAGFSVLVSTTSNPYTWTSVFGPTTLDYQQHTFSFTETSARYVMLKVYNPGDWRLMNVYDARLYDRFGIYGAPYAASRSNPRSYHDILGINGIWGWGTNTEPATSPNTGPRLFVPVASHARNYHNLNWDLTKPTDVVYYNVSGTPAQWWLDWNIAYQNWKDAGFQVIDAAIQFGNGSWPQYEWPDPYNNAYTYGKDFASNFGPSHKNLINLVEVGNEPWDYNADFYVQILEGMSKGLRDGDPNIMIAPGAFQADTPDVPPQGDGISYNAKYAGYRISQTALQYVNVLNSHCYSYAVVSGVYKGVRPEYPTTNFKAFRNMLRWRDVNTPSSEVWLTEWGWDGSSSCVDTRCVSLVSEAVYGIRGLLIGAREGLNRMTWFYYADGGDGTTVYDWSGLVTASNAKKPAYYAFVNFLSVLGGYHHFAALREADDAYIYVVASGSSYKLVAWRPVDGDVSTTEATVTVTITGFSLSDTTFVEIGTSTSGVTTRPTTDFSQSGTTFTMKLSGYPRVANVVATTTTGGSTTGSGSTIGQSTTTGSATPAPTPKPTSPPTPKPTSPPTPKPTSPPTPKPTPSPTSPPTPSPTPSQAACGNAVIGSGTGLRYFSLAVLALFSVFYRFIF